MKFNIDVWWFWRWFSFPLVADRHWLFHAFASWSTIALLKLLVLPLLCAHISSQIAESFRANSTPQGQVRTAAEGDITLFKWLRMKLNFFSNIWIQWHGFSQQPLSSSQGCPILPFSRNRQTQSAKLKMNFLLSGEDFLMRKHRVFVFCWVFLKKVVTSEKQVQKGPVLNREFNFWSGVIFKEPQLEKVNW